MQEEPTNDSPDATVAVSPAANVEAGTEVTLDASNSSDPDGDPLTYEWTLTTPSGSSTSLSANSGSSVTFTPDVSGTYGVELVVDDGNGGTGTASETVTANTNTAPIAEMSVSPSNMVETGVEVSLDASGSSDADGDPLTYEWTLDPPQGSSAMLSSTTGSMVTFTPETTGDYAAVVTVADGNGATATVSETITASPPPAIIVDSDITTNTTWESGRTYRVVTTVSVRSGATLTIEPDVRVEFEQATGLTFTDGILEAAGTEADPIRMTGTETTPGHWRGLAFYPNAITSRLDHVEVAYAGQANQPFSSFSVTAAVLLDRDTQVELTNTQITDSETYGLYTKPDAARLPSFASNAFARTGDAPVYIPASNMGAMDENTTFDDGDETTPSYVLVYGNRIADAMTINPLDVPYRIEQQDTPVADAELTLEAGVTLLFEEAAGFQLDNNSALTVSGTDANPVRFSGTRPTPGHWRGLRIDPNPVEHEMTYAVVEFGGGGAQYNNVSERANVALDRDSRLRLTNSTIRESGSFGLHANDRSTRLPGFASNTFSQNTAAPLHIPIDIVGAPDAGSSFADNPNSYVRIWGGYLNQDATVAGLDVPYRVSAATTAIVNQQFTLDAGVQFEFEEAAGLVFDNDSKAVANGTASSPVVFTSAAANPSRGDWLGIRVDPNPLTHSLTNVRVSYGGRSALINLADSQGNIVLDRDTNLELTDAEITDSAGYGLYLNDASSVLTETGTTYSNNADGPKN